MMTETLETVTNKKPEPTAEEVAHRLGAGDVEAPLVPPDEIILIMETVDTVLAQARGDA